MKWDDSLDPFAITVPEVLSGETVVLLALRDSGHGGWQFMDGKDVAGRKPKVNPKTELLQRLPALAEVIDLPVGWRARRISSKDPWFREQIRGGK